MEMRRRDWQHSGMAATSMRNGRSRAGDAAAQEERLAEEATAWFVRMTSDLVTEADRRSFQAWLAQDPEHLHAYAEAESLWKELEAVPDLRDAGREDRALDLSAVSTEEGGESRRKAPRRARRGIGDWRMGALAASLLLAAALGLLGGDVYDSWRADHRTAVGEIRSVVLQDGSRVHLNSNTALAVDFTEDRRRIDLYRGEAFFAVASDPQRPFEILAGDGVAKAVGTAFNVRQIEDSVDVAVTEGRVEVRWRPDFEADGEAVTLGAGQAARYGAARGADGEIQTVSVDVAALTAWRQERLVFADRPLRAVIAELDRYRPGRILFLESAIAEARFTGALDLRDSDQALTAIETTLPVEAVRLTPWLTLLRARD
ncbi:MAG: FecR family protein [Kiloniellales bacterium]